MDRNSKMVVKISISAYIICILAIVSGCMGDSMEQKDIIGLWRSEQGASIEFNSNRTFSSTRIPLLIAGLDSDNQYADGGGIWLYRLTTEGVELDISFDKSNSIKLIGYSNVPHLTKEGLLENRLPWYLYFWEDVETGKRYKFYKQKKLNMPIL